MEGPSSVRRLLAPGYRVQRPSGPQPHQVPICSMRVRLGKLLGPGDCEYDITLRALAGPGRRAPPLKMVQEGRRQKEMTLPPIMSAGKEHVEVMNLPQHCLTLKQGAQPATSMLCALGVASCTPTSDAPHTLLRCGSCAACRAQHDLGPERHLQAHYPGHHHRLGL